MLLADHGRIAGIMQTVIQIVAARARLHSESPEAALEELNPVLERHPDNVIANTVLIEINIIIGDYDFARELFENVLDSGRIPIWLDEHIQALKHELPE